MHVQVGNRSRVDPHSRVIERLVFPSSSPSQATHDHWRQLLGFGRRGRRPLRYIEVRHEDLSEGAAAPHHWHALTAFLGLEPQDPRSLAGLVRVHPGSCGDKIINAAVRPRAALPCKQREQRA